MYDIITFGSITKDIFVRPKKLSLLQYDATMGHGGFCFLPGTKVDVDEMRFASGGGGTNTAATFAKQGLKTAFVGVIGPDLAGEELVSELRDLGVETKFIALATEKPTNHSVIVLNEALDRTVLAYRGASELLDVDAIPFKQLKTKWLYLSPLTGKAAWHFGVIMDFAKDTGIRVACNPSMAQLSMPQFADIARTLDVLLLNQEEASFLTKIASDREHEIFKKIDAMVPGVAVMTKGGEGVTVSDGKFRYAAHPFRERLVVDTLGAGDAFGSGFVAEFMQSGDIEKSIQLGMANSEACLREIGAKKGLLVKGQPFRSVAVAKEECNNEVCLVK